MLKSIFIQNYALIDHLDIHFSRDFSTITGETGAGKSIIMGALSLIMGQRADSDLLKNKDEKCIVEAHFEVSDKIKKSFLENDLDYEKESVFRREILPNGKSRAFINDTPVNINVLREISDKLIDIHSQHQTLNLKDKDFQLDIIDKVAQNNKIREQYFSVLSEYRRLKEELENLIKSAEKARADMDYYQYQYDQLSKAEMRSGIQEELETEYNEQTHAEEIKAALFNTADSIADREINILNQLKEIRNGFEKVKNHFPASVDYISRIDSVIIELKDISAESAKKSAFIEFNPQRIEEINEKLNLIYELQKKHNLHSVDELIEFQKNLKEKIESVESSDHKISELRKSLENCELKLMSSANNLTESRKKVAPLVEDKLIFYLKQLGIPYAVIKVEMSLFEDYMDTGKDNICLLFSANNKIDPAEISRIASGGELSRLMLSIKAMLSGRNDIPVLIFDEIDMGVSGEIAYKMGGIMYEISKKNQVIAITHLPQVASKGKSHYQVYKEFNQSGTTTKIRLLDDNERIMEIAKMLSGDEISDAAIKNAKELLLV